MAIDISDANMLKRLLWLIYAEEALEKSVSLYNRAFLSRLKRKVKKQLERSKKNDELAFDVDFVAM